jgi:hypothetical protein
MGLSDRERAAAYLEAYGVTPSEMYLDRVMAQVEYHRARGFSDNSKHAAGSCAYCDALAVLAEAL